jgi:hypothetical protein
MVNSGDQHAIDSFLSGHLTEKEFLESINYRESWRFPWAHYSELFKLAKENSLKVYGLNSQGTLEERDDHAAKIISKVIKKDSRSKFLTLFGELHIIPDKLPRKVQKHTNNKFRDLIVHQNLDQIYWRQLEQNPESRIESSIVKLNENEVSLQNSPPWIKLESYIYWFENLVDDPEFDIHEYSIETSVKLFNSNIYDNFSYFTKKICDSLNIKMSPEEIESYNLYDHQSLEYVLAQVMKKNGSEFYQSLIKESEIFQIFGSNIFYCPSYSLNRIVYLSGNHIFSTLFKRNKNLGPDDEYKFTYLVFYFSFGYFCSKILNPYRKCLLYPDLQKELEILNSQESIPEKKSPEIYYALAVDILDQTADIEKIDQMSLDTKYHSAKLAGNCIGDLIYSKYDTLGKFWIEKMINLLIEDKINSNSLFQLINDLKESNPDFYTRPKKIF